MSRSISAWAVFEAAQAEMERLRRELRVGSGKWGHRGMGIDGTLDGVAHLADDCWWGEAEDRAYAEDEELLLTDPFALGEAEGELLLAADPFAEEGYEWDARRDARPDSTGAVRAALKEPVEKRAVTVHRWGQRLSGVVFSQGGPISFVMYRKDWEARLTGKRHMEPLWQAAGWNGQAPVTRHEARLVRDPIRELRLVTVERDHQQQQTSLDDPWQFLASLAEVWGTMVGRADACPEAVDVAWIRRVVPRAGERNRSRWDTDSTWRVVQRADFNPAALTARRLMRQQQRRHAVEQIDQQLLGLLKTREALLHADPVERDLSVAVRDMLRSLERELQRRGEDFGAAARLRRRGRGLPVGLPGKVLPFRPHRTGTDIESERACLLELDRAIDATGVSVGWSDAAGLSAGSDEWIVPHTNEGSGRETQRVRNPVRTGVWLRWRSAELRMCQVYAMLEEAEVAGRPRRELEQLAASFERSAAAYAAAEEMVLQLEPTADGGCERSGESSAHLQSGPSGGTAAQ
jgi:hypothetical protein